MNEADVRSQIAQLASELAGLRHELTRLQDLEAIRRLIAEFAYAIDRGAFEVAAAMYEHGTFAISGRTFTGPDELLAFLVSTVRTYDDGTPKTLHSTGNVVIDLDSAGLVAHATSCTVVFQAVEGFPLQPIVHTRYLEDFEKVGGAWRRTRHLHERPLAGDSSHHVLAKI